MLVFKLDIHKNLNIFEHNDKSKIFIGKLFYYLFFQLLVILIIRTEKINAFYVKTKWLEIIILSLSAFFHFKVKVKGKGIYTCNIRKKKEIYIFECW